MRIERLSSQVTLFQGDCLEIMPTLGPSSIDMVCSDPPYGTTACKWDAVIPFKTLWSEYNRIIKPGAPIVLHAAQPFTSALVMSNVRQFKYEWIWDKRIATGALNSKIMPMRAHESILVFGSGSITYRPQKTERTAEELKRIVRNAYNRAPGHGGPAYGATKSDVRLGRDARQMKPPTTVIRIGALNGCHPERTGHPTQKPVALADYLIRTYSDEGGLILDNCMGSATTGIAAHRTGRSFIGIEKDEKHFETALRRMEIEMRTTPSIARLQKKS